ncbi:MAG: cupin domain-containing protein [Proteobacteria bacterium]|nr:cupin domain-containing protein [Pseudomonadota bacterium]MBU1058215.1 cupin domain-containing protein [Pseudomonadota bacterium]
MVSYYPDVSSYITRDGSTIRELIHPNQHGAGNQSLAEARVAPGCSTLLHRHEKSEEIYHITAGHARMILESGEYLLAPGDSVRILSGTSHRLINIGSEELCLLCCCSPPYSHEDTVLLASP